MRRIIYIIIIVLLLPTFAFSQGGGYGIMNQGWHMMYYGCGGIIMWLLLLIVVGLLVYLAAQLSRGGSNEKKSQETALDILKKRDARGEINTEEFERIKQDLQI
jgi:putative membrane protein